MNPKYTIHEWIDRYLDGEMDGLERSEFESKLHHDDEFAKTFEVHKIAHEIVVGKELLTIKKQMDKDLSGGLDHVGGRNNLRVVLGVGAVILTAVILYLLFIKE